jgi:hypothetical protein
MLDKFNETKNNEIQRLIEQVEV